MKFIIFFSLALAEYFFIDNTVLITIDSRIQPIKFLFQNKVCIKPNCYDNFGTFDGRVITGVPLELNGYSGCVFSNPANALEVFWCEWGNENFKNTWSWLNQFAMATIEFKKLSLLRSAILQHYFFIFKNVKRSLSREMRFQW